MVDFDKCLDFVIGKGGDGKFESDVVWRDSNDFGFEDCLGL